MRETRVRTPLRLGGEPGEQRDRVRLWMLEAGADIVEPDAAAAGVVWCGPGPAPASGLPVLDAQQGVGRREVSAFVHRFRGGTPHGGETDDHGSPSAWPRGSF